MTRRLLLVLWMSMLLVVGLEYWVQLLVIGVWGPALAGDRLSRIVRTINASVSSLGTRR